MGKSRYGSRGLDPGFIYVVQMEGHEIYKIGRTNNVPNRMSQIGIQLPFPYRLRFAHKVPLVHFTESDLHRDFSHCRKNGEWFELTEAGLHLIKCRLLYRQANWLSHEIRECFYHEELQPFLIHKYGRLFTFIGRRNDRRLKRLEAAESRFADEYLGLDILSAETVV